MNNLENNTEKIEVKITNTTNKLNTIKFVKEKLNLFLKDAKESIDNLPYIFSTDVYTANEFVENAAENGFSCQISSISINSAKKTETENNIITQTINNTEDLYEIYIEKIDNSKKIETIKLIRLITNEGLAESKNIVDKQSFKLYVKTQNNEIDEIAEQFKNANCVFSHKKILEPEAEFKIYE